MYTVGHWDKLEGSNLVCSNHSMLWKQFKKLCKSSWGANDFYKKSCNKKFLLKNELHVVVEVPLSRFSRVFYWRES